MITGPVHHPSFYPSPRDDVSTPTPAATGGYDGARVKCNIMFVKLFSSYFRVGFSVLSHMRYYYYYYIKYDELILDTFPFGVRFRFRTVGRKKIIMFIIIFIFYFLFVTIVLRVFERGKEDFKRI